MKRKNRKEENRTKKKEKKKKKKEKKTAEVHPSGSDFNKASVLIPTPQRTNRNTANIVTPIHLPLP